MLFTFFYTLCALETFLLSAYLAAVGSYAKEGLILNLSTSRLAIVLFFLVCGMGFIFLAVRSLNSISKQYAFQENYLDNEKSQWLTFVISLSAIGLALFFLTRQLNSFGGFKQIYQRFEPALVWLAVLSAQTAFLTAVWYCAHFIPVDNKRITRTTQKELLPLMGLYLGFVILKLIFVTRTSYGPVGRGDEMTYFDMADSFYRGFFSIAQSHHYPPLYPLSILVALVFKNWTFDGIKLLNAIYSSSIIFPVYFIARRFMDAPKSLAAVFLSCLIPYHLVFPRRIVSENLFFPLFLWTMFITFVIPKNNKFRLSWDLLNGVMIAILYLTRYITLAVIPFFILSWWVKPFNGEKSLFSPGWKKVMHCCMLITAMLVAYSPWLLAGLSEKVELKLILGFEITSQTTPGQLTLPRLLDWVVLYACYFILVAAPVLHLLIASLFQIKAKNWREGSGRLIFMVLAVMGGFYAAVTRHSWRAYYNREIPSVIMGRYLIVFSVAYFVIALVALCQFSRSNFRSKWHFILAEQVFPFILVTLAYLTLIKGMFIPTDGDLLKSLGSVDAFFTEILGGYFFLLLFLIYGITNWLIWKGNSKSALTALIAGLVIYYAVGIPSYYQTLMDYQTYPWLASRIVQIAPQPDPKSGEYERITVFLPKERTSSNKVEIFNGLRTHGINDTQIEVYSPEAVAAMVTEKGFIIQNKATGDEQFQDYAGIQFNNQEFVIIPVQK
jgi:hypothetical protein